MGKESGRKWWILVILIITFWAGFLLSIQGCAPFRVIMGDATPADCTATKAYIDMCSTELFKDNLPAGLRAWWELALAGAQVEFSAQCDGVVQ